jgi:hypothetical protein
MSTQSYGWFILAVNYQNRGPDLKNLEIDDQNIYDVSLDLSVRWIEHLVSGAVLYLSCMLAL